MCVVSSRTSADRQAMSMKTCSIGPIHSTLRVPNEVSGEKEAQEEW